MRSPILSVIMPVYNGEEHVSASIDSVLSQTFSDFELIVVDDGSTDATSRIVADHAKMDPRLRVISNASNLGIADSLNKGLTAARGIYIARMDADDISLPERMALQIKHMLEHPEITVCGCWMRALSGGRVISYPSEDRDIRSEMLFRNPLPHPGVMFKKDVVIQAGGYDSGYAPAEDYDLWIRLALCPGIRFANLSQVLVLYNEPPEACRAAYYIEQFLKSGSVRAKLLAFADARELRLHEDLSSLFAPSVAAKRVSDNLCSYKAWLSRAGDQLVRMGFLSGNSWKKLSRAVLLRAAVRKILPRKVRRTKMLFYSDSPVVGGSEIYLAGLASGMDRSKYEPVHVCVKGRDVSRVKEILSGTRAYAFPRLAIFIALPVLLLKERPDIVHLNLNVPFSCFYMMFLLKFFRGARIVATVHSTIPPRSRSAFFRAVKSLLCRYLFPVVDRFICVSNSSKEDFCRNYGISGSKVSVVYNGIRPFAADPLKAGGDISCVGCVARLDRDKGIEFLLRAFSSLCPAYPGLKCLIAGEGGDIKRLKKLAASLGISGSVEFAGYISDKARLYSSFDLFVLPSLHEAFPLTVLEAMSAGKPVVATAVGGIPEAVEDGVTGILVPPKDTAALARAIGALLNDPARAHEMGARGDSRCEERFSFDSMIQGTAEVYVTASASTQNLTQK